MGQRIPANAMQRRYRSRRVRVYKFYARARGYAFLNRSIAYSKGTHRWIYEVRATSLKQAYALGYREVFAPDAKHVGVLRIERDWWHYTTAPGFEERMVAPYLRHNPDAVLTS
jgi:hypothetical protein